MISTHHALFFNVLCNELKKQGAAVLPEQRRGTADGYLAARHRRHAVLPSCRVAGRAARGAEVGRAVHAPLQHAARDHGEDRQLPWLRTLRRRASSATTTTRTGRLHKRVINLMSHGNYSLYEPQEMMDENKELLPEDASASSSAATRSTRHCSDDASNEETTRMTEQDQKQLGKTLWNIADQLRGAMNADDFRDYMLSFLFLRYLSDNYERRRRRSWARTIPTRTPSATAGGRRCRSGTRTTRTTWPRSRSRCAARCITSSSPSTSGATSPTWPARRTASCSTRCRRASSTSRTNRSRAPFRGCSRRSTSPRTSSAGSTPTATPSSARSSRRSPRGWRSSRPTSTRWATPTST